MMSSTTSTRSRLLVLAALFLAVIATVGFSQPYFFQASTITTVLQFSSMLALVSLGQALIILAGGTGIDLSVGGMVSLSSVLSVIALQAGLPPALLPAAPILIGVALGAVNGVLVTRVGILPLIATLGTFFVYGGLAMALTNGTSLSGLPAWLGPFGRGMVWLIPYHFLFIVVPLFLAVAVMLTLTSWGRWLYAMGHNERSARLVGIPVDRVRFIAYCFSGALSGLAGLVSLAWFGSGRPNIGQNLELESLAAVLLGGIVITGGSGGVLGVVVAVLMIVTLKTGLQLMNLSTVWQVGIVGALLLAVLLAERVHLAALPGLRKRPGPSS